MRFRQYFILKFLFLLAISCLVTINNVYSQITQTFGVGSHTWVCPANVYQVRVQCWGGGQAGSSSRAGGAGGAYASGSINVIPGNTYYLNCGNGGLSNNGAIGGDSWFCSTNSVPTSTQNGVLAKGGIGSINSSYCIGDTIFSGGLSGVASGTCGGGGGSAAGPLGIGVDGSASIGGIANNGGGNGGKGSCLTSQSATSGQIPGGGGGGASAPMYGSYYGPAGLGAGGKIVLNYQTSCSGTPNSGIASFTVGNSCGSILLSATGLTSSPGISYQWQESTDNLSFNNIINSNSSTLTTNSYQDKYYRLTTNCIYGGTSFSNVVFSVSPLSISGTASSDQSICTGSTSSNLVLTSYSGSIQWQLSSDNISYTNILNATSATYSPGILTSTRYYRALVTNGNCSTDTTNRVSLIIYPTSVAGTASTNQSICSGTLASAINLVGNNSSNLIWQVSTNSSTWSNIIGANNTTLASNQIGNLTSIRYYRAKVISGSCPEVYSNTVTISILSLPTINAGIDKSVCSGSSVTLSGTGGTSYSWDGGVTNNISFVPLSTYSYTLTGTASNGCQNTDAVLVTVNPLPTVSIINNNPSIICQGQSFTLSSSSTNATNYQWKRNGINISGATTSSLTNNLAGNYTLFVTSPFGCNETSSIVPISITPLPTVNAGLDQTICAGQNVTLAASGSSNYSWNNGVLNGVSFTPTNSNTYTVSTTSTNGCVGTDQVNIEVHNSSYSNLYTTSLGNYFLNGTEYSQTGVYTQTIQNQWGCDSLITLNLTVSYLNLDEIEFKGLTIFPNPSLDGKFNIHSEQSINYFQIEVKDVSGRIQKYLNNLSDQIDLSNLPSGIYLLEIKSLTSSKTIRLIKL